MRNIFLAWSDFKQNAKVIRDLKIQEINFDGHYQIIAYESNVIEFECRIDKTTPANADQTDYQDNYQSSSNQPVITKAVSKVCTNKAVTIEGVATVKFKIPADGRKIGKGCAWTYSSHEDDLFLVSIVAANDAELATFNDDDVEDYQSGGLRSVKGLAVTLDNLTNLQPLPGNQFLKVQCITGDLRADTLFVNIIWGE